MIFTTLPRSRGTSEAAQRMHRAGLAHETRQPVPPPTVVQAKASRPGTRSIRPHKLGKGTKPNEVTASPPDVRLVYPTELHVEEAYQRDLSPKSDALIRKIVASWDWTKFKPPICAETDDGLYVIDGQHTAIAAASHPNIKKIPVLIVPAESVARRAASFVSHNRDRITLSPFQRFHAEVAAGEREAVALAGVLKRAGASIPRRPVGKKDGKPGQILSVAEIARVYRTLGGAFLTRLLKIAGASAVAPVPVILLRGLRIVLSDARFSSVAALDDERISAAVSSLKNADNASRVHAMATGGRRDQSCATLIANAAGVRTEGAPS